MRLSRTLWVSLLWAGLLAAQTNRGGISGTVSDATGAVIPGATVTITSLATNQVWKLKTSEAGVYSLQSLDPVTYKVVVEAEGFKKAIIEEVKVDTATIQTVNVTLQAGDVKTEVNVTAEAPLVNAESGTTGNTITEREIVDIPLNNRSVLDLAVTLPNVSGDVGSEDPAVTSGATVPGFNLSVNGGRPGSTAMLADGVVNTGVGLARAVVSFSPETVQEFTVQTSAYSAEYGQTGGGVINATTKSGSNQLAGTALWYTRNPATNAAPFTTASVNRPVSNLRNNQFSLTAGGPVVLPKLYDGRNRTFFFAAFEPRYRQDHVQADSLLPTDAMRDGDFSGIVPVSGGWAPADVAARFGVRVTGDSTIFQQFNLVGNQLQAIPAPRAGQTYLPFPGNRIPKTMMDPSSLKALQYLPHAGEYYINGSGALVNWSTQRFVKQNEKRVTARIDQIISDRNRLNFRITSIPAVGQKGFGSDVNGNGADYSYSRQLMLADTHTISPTLINDLRLNYTRGRFSGSFTPEFDVKTGRNLSTELGLPSLTKGGLPMFTFELNSFGNIGSQGSTLNENVEERYNISDILYKSTSKMTWKVGFDITHARLNVMNLYAAAGGVYAFRYVQTNSNGATSGYVGGNAFASFLLGVPNNVTLKNVLIPYYYRWNSGAGFVQNDWKVKPNLTLNLGLRYSLQLPRTEKYNHQGVFRPDLAKEYLLPQPLTLITGQVITKAVVPPFAYSGYGGRSKYLYDPNYLDFEPRFGFAWTPGFLRERHVTVRGGYGISHAPLTGNNRLPNPDFGGSTPTLGWNSGQKDPNYVMRIGSNPPVISPISPDDYLKIPKDGLVYLDGINIPGFIISNNTRTPYVQNWNLTISWQAARSMVVEAAYVGSKGTHLFMPGISVNPRDFNYVQALNGANLNPETAVNDPLGRLNVSNRIVTVPLGDLANPYLGFQRLNSYYDASANSIRHATYISVTRRTRTGLAFTGNYTFGKSIDDASDAAPDKNVLTTGRVDGQVTFGGTRKGDRSVSTFDIKHNFNSTFLYDLPFGRGKKYLSHSWKPLRLTAGDWTLSGVFRLMGGYPAIITMSDSNGLGSGTHTIRPDLNPGVPIVNPNWKRSCPVGNLCEPYINPAAFMRPAKGQLGSAPRTFDGARGPMQRYFDASVQKNFRIDDKRRVQFRVDFINAFNHPVFRTYPNNGGGTDVFSAPNEGVISASDYNAWAAANGKPLSTTPDGAALLARVQQIVTGSRLPSGALPVDFFRIPLPQDFFSKQPVNFDITTPDGYKLYRLRQAWQNGGVLYAPQNPRYIQFGIKIFF
jgi:hypothetical protein